MAHCYKIIKNPVKCSNKITEITILNDGLWINWDDQFNLKIAPIGSSQDTLNNCIKEYCKYIICRDTIHDMHVKYGESAYYKNLNIQIEPSKDFNEFKNYCKLIVETHEKSYFDVMEEGYQHLCKVNNVYGNIGKLF